MILTLPSFPECFARMDSVFSDNLSLAQTLLLLKHFMYLSMQNQEHCQEKKKCFFHVNLNGILALLHCLFFWLSVICTSDL